MRRHDEIADVPVFIVSEEVLDMADVAIGGVNVVAFYRGCAE